MRLFKMQASMSVKGVYTSDIAYSSMTLPKGMQLKVPKDKDWFNEYSWIQLPHSEAVKTTTKQSEFRKTETDMGKTLNADLTLDGAR